MLIAFDSPADLVWLVALDGGLKGGGSESGGSGSGGSGSGWPEGKRSERRSEDAYSPAEALGGRGAAEVVTVEKECDCSARRSAQERCAAGTRQADAARKAEAAAGE
ncbi:unnamed protein product [Closterium sp. NIES-54]